MSYIYPRQLHRMNTKVGCKVMSQEYIVQNYRLNFKSRSFLT